MNLDKRRMTHRLRGIRSEAAGALKEVHCPKPGMDGVTHVSQE